MFKRLLALAPLGFASLWFVTQLLEIHSPIMYRNLLAELGIAYFLHVYAAFALVWCGFLCGWCWHRRKKALG